MRIALPKPGRRMKSWLSALGKRIYVTFFVFVLWYVFGYPCEYVAIVLILSRFKNAEVGILK